VKTSRFDFRLPQRLIAKVPAEVRGERRDHARLVVLDRRARQVVHRRSVAAEWYEVPAATTRTINAARRRGNRIVAVGTTVVRTLETVAREP
jgi:S-adenosylmethionine:tRNA-ribosyltransferase-isomerase (queuine synthetase)